MQGIPIESGDVLQLTSWCIRADIFSLRAIIVRPDGSISRPTLQQVGTGDRSGTNTNLALITSGTLVAAGVNQDGGTIPSGPGETFIAVNIFGPGSKVKAHLFSGYFFPGHVPSYPVGQIEHPTEGKGRIRTVIGTNPAANTEVTETVPTNALWKLRSFSVVLVATGVANRNTNLIIDDGAVTARKRIYTDTTNQTDTQTRTHLWTRGNEAWDLASDSVTDTQTVLHKSCLDDDIYLVAGDRIRTLTTNIAAADDYAAPIFEVEEWLAPT